MLRLDIHMRGNVDAFTFVVAISLIDERNLCSIGYC